MSSIEKTVAGKWLARYRDPLGRSRRQTFVRKADAQRFLEGTGVDMQRGSWVDPQLGRTTLSDWVGEWWTTAVDLRPSTLSRYERDLRLHLLPRFGDRPLATITPREVRAWVAEMAAEGVPPSGINRRLRLFSRLLNAAVENEMIARSPAKGVRAPQAPRTEARFLSASEVRDLAEAINPWFRVWVYFAAYTGVRWSEMLGLRRKDVDLLRRTVTIERQILEVQSRFLGFGPPKSAAGRRTITASWPPCWRTNWPSERSPGPRAWSSSTPSAIRRTPLASPPSPGPGLNAEPASKGSAGTISATPPWRSPSSREPTPRRSRNAWGTPA
jgi:hypothetical protein